MNLYSQLLKDLRQELAITQCDFAKALNVSQSAISKIEKGKMTPSLDAFLRAARMASIHSDKMHSKFCSAIWAGA